MDGQHDLHQVIINVAVLQENDLPGYVIFEIPHPGQPDKTLLGA